MSTETSADVKPARDPWKLSARQTEAMDAWLSTGCCKRGAEAMGIHKQTFSCHTSRARAKMNARTLILALVQWDRYRCGDVA